MATREMRLKYRACHAACALDLPLSYRGPFDERLLVQAQEEGLKFLTADRRLVRHPLAVAA